ncbi:uncharacterized protein A4U43_C09F4230 [Asparagus officinalis]|uniref:non-specific serine/threonine protein kinase n=2 Tax=Asparagus officinalis TaxID=4686 RepID=A0A5P1E590_ASPOF|nr:uncharacterized protein A4U43_C09F4230 [Asparagus officinalis]
MASFTAYKWLGNFNNFIHLHGIIKCWEDSGTRIKYRNWIWLRKICSTCLLSLLLQIMFISADTDPKDAVALTSLGNLWKNKPSNWVGLDPCGDSWIGIRCTDSRITSITLSSLGLEGTLSGDIQSLTELQALDLSYNKGLTGGLPASIGSLIKLQNLILVGCSFSGEIPPEIGSLKNLVFLSLNSNRFTGSIPATIGNLSNLYWLDLADNQLSGTIPVSNGTTPGLDLLTHTKHFHFGMNQLSGEISSKLFSSDMILIHVLFDDNKLTGSIPSTLGLVKALEVVRLDRNSLTGPVPTNINNLTKVAELHLSNNKLTGPLPNLTGMNALAYLDMSNNTFDAPDAPPWFSTLPSLTTLYLENLRIGGQVPEELFSSSPLQSVNLRANHFNGTLNIGSGFSNELQLVDLRNNLIDQVTVGGYKKGLLLMGNPFCTENGPDFLYCKPLKKLAPSYSTPKNCVPFVCPSGQDLSPKCKCAYPYSGTLFFRAPKFSDLENITYYQSLEASLRTSFMKRQLPIDSVSLKDPSTDSNNYLNIILEVFPAGVDRFDQLDILNLGFILSNQTFKPPSIFGPFYFMAEQYSAFRAVPSSSPKKSSNTTAIIGAAVGVAVLVMIMAVIAVFVVRKKKKSEKYREQTQPFESWEPSRNIGAAPQLKGARWFSFEEIKKCTNDFSGANDIGCGGYGKVYRGTLSNGQLIAVKRAQQGSTQGGLEFKTEIELLSRVHHKNLVSLIGFCFEQGEQMLVYEYIPNGSLKESLSGKSGIHLDWKRRLRVALGTARGLAYLHELADPPIIHRDIKSSNILLDDVLNAKVSDFGLSKPMGDDNKTHVTTQVKGTMGYLDPEYYMTQQLTEKSDVYGFGVLLLELITAKKPIERGRYVVREVRIKMDKTMDLYGLQELIDPMIGLGTTLGGFEKFVDLTVKCVAEMGVDRPTMSEVVKELEIIMHIAGMNPGTESASSSSVSYEATSRGTTGHPYGSESAFDYSVGVPPSKVEPK